MLRITVYSLGLFFLSPLCFASQDITVHLRLQIQAWRLATFIQNLTGLSRDALSQLVTDFTSKQKCERTPFLCLTESDTLHQNAVESIYSSLSTDTISKLVLQYIEVDKQLCKDWGWEDTPLMELAFQFHLFKLFTFLLLNTPKLDLSLIVDPREGLSVMHILTALRQDEVLENHIISTTDVELTKILSQKTEDGLDAWDIVKEISYLNKVQLPQKSQFNEKNLLAFLNLFRSKHCESWDKMCQRNAETAEVIEKARQRCGIKPSEEESYW
jgi:hypothetical protein